MSRCFPEPADLMAVFRLTRGIDARDVANAHLCSVEKRLSGFNRFIISGATPFNFLIVKLYIMMLHLSSSVNVLTSR